MTTYTALRKNLVGRYFVFSRVPVSNKATNEKIAILLNLGFEMDELACFGVSRADLKKYKEGLYDSIT